MRRIFLFILICISGYVYGDGKGITIDLRNVTVKTALEALERESGVSFWLNTQDVDLEKIISVNLDNQSLDEALSIILDEQNVCYEFKSSHIIITKKKARRMQNRSIHTTVDRIINGFIINESGQALPNAIVRDKISQEECFSDDNGHFSIAIPATSKILSFSFLGMRPQDLPVKNDMNVKMVYMEQEMAEFVVTALDIKRNRKSLPYSSQAIEESDISRTRALNFTTNLIGAVPGANILPSTSGFGGSTKIVLRGTKNITSTNQPLFVIDGIPVMNTQTSDPYGFYSGRDSGDGLSNINPDEIETLTILKGANAAALYGSQGSNGVILITTKKGKSSETAITFNSGVSFASVSEYPKLQYEFGQTSSGTEDSWGSKGDYPNFVKDFFKTGKSFQNSISISGGNEKIKTFFAYANVNSSGVMPTNRYQKNNLSFRQSSSFWDNRLTLSSSIMLTEERLHNTILNGYYWNPLLGLYNFPRSLDFSYYKDNYEILDSERNIMSQNWPITGNAEGQMNPYWILNNDPDNTHTKRIFANIALEYNLAKGITLNARGNYDYTNQLYEMKAMATSSSVLVSDNGRYVYSNLNSWQSYADLLLSYDKILFENFDIHAIAGTSYQKKVLGDGLFIDSQTYGLTIVNNFTIQNIASLLAFTNSQQIVSRLVKESVFGNLSIGYKDKIFLDLSGRNDWSSSLAFTNRISYFYPSVGISLLTNQLVQLPSQINFAKVRASFAQVSNEIPAFISNPTGSVSANGYSSNFVKAFSNLKAEMSNNIEIGLDLNMFDNKLSTDITCYQIDTRDQYLMLQAPSGSGYTTYYVNAGHVRTKGLEISLKYKPVSTKDLNWNCGLNLGSNSNKIIALSDELTGVYKIPGGGEGYEMKIVKDGSMGDIYTYAYTRDEEGHIILDDDHIPQKTTLEKKIGNANPKWILGWNNSIKYRNIELSFSVEGKFGGKFVSMTQAYLDRNGVTQTTAEARNNGGVWVNGVMSDGSSWSGQVDAKSYYTGTAGRAGIMEQYVYNATNVYVKNIILDYTFNFPKSRKTKVKGVTLSIISDNPLYIYKKVPGNPNRTISTGNGSQSVENFGLPPVRNLTFNIKLSI